MSREARAWGMLAERAAELVQPKLAARVQGAVRKRRAQARTCRLMAVSALVLTLGVNAILLVLARSSAPAPEQERAFLAERYELLRSL